MRAELLQTISEECEAEINYGSDLSQVELVPTGIRRLDEAIGGIPRGRIVEIFGPEGSGKTALALHLARALGGPVLYGDADHGLTQYILQGTDLENDMYLLHSSTLQEALGACRIAAAGFAAVVLDTVTAYPTKEDMRTSFRDGRFRPSNPTSRVMAHAVPVLLPLLYESGCTLIVVSQTRYKPGVIYGNPEYSTGGRATACFAALRLGIRAKERIRVRVAYADEKTIGQKMCVTVAKCKYGPPWATASISLNYEGGGIREDD